LYDKNTERQKQKVKTIKEWILITKPMNLVFIMSDEHNKEMLGCNGHPVVKTPNLDKLAENGVNFTSAYCNSPICVPSRASFATGRYVHEIKSWDNAAPYTGEIDSWGHRLSEQGYKVVSIGKLHYRDDSDDNGFTDARLSMNVFEGLGDTYSLVRDNKEPRTINRDKILEAGPGESPYTRYDRGITEEAIRFLREEAKDFDQPWAIFVSLVTPHFPLIAPQEYYDMYPLEDVVFPRQYSLSERPMHPALEEYRKTWDVSDELDEKTVRKAVAAYYGLCTFLDTQVGKIVDTIKEEGLEDNTRIIYTSDHGDTLGNHGVWFKSTMYDGSVGVPFIMSGPDLPKSKKVDTNISLVDCFPTIIECLGAKFNESDENLPGESLFSLLDEDESNERIAFSEYHAMGFAKGVFMIKDNRYKFVYYVGKKMQLFDLIKDPEELHDLVDDSNYIKIKEQCEEKLRAIVDPEKIDEEARRDQGKMIEGLGGKDAIIEKGFQVPFSPVPVQFQEK